MWIIGCRKHSLALFYAESMSDMNGCSPALITAKPLGSNHQAQSPQRACRKAEQVGNSLGGGAAVDRFL
jgi:hypothetical protein